MPLKVELAKNSAFHTGAAQETAAAAGVAVSRPPEAASAAVVARALNRLRVITERGPFPDLWETGDGVRTRGGAGRSGWGRVTAGCG
ncbi:hypothetical protein ACWCQ0_46075, partial [Streptomyces massasporeus]